MGLSDLVRKVLGKSDVRQISSQEAPAPQPKGAFTGTLWTLSIPRAGTTLTAPVLRQAYERSSLIRYCVEAIVNQIVSLDIEIDAETDASKRRADEIIKGYNVAKESFKDTLSQFIRDLLTLDAGVIMKVSSLDGILRQLLVRDAATFIPVRNDRGVLIGYRQEVTVNGKVITTPFNADEILYQRLFPKSYATYGTSLIESVTNEVTALLYAGKSFADALSEDAARDGILHLGSISDEAYQRATQSFESAKTKRTIRVVDNVDKIEWITIGRSPAELQIADQVRMVERIVLRVYGFLDPEVGLAPQYKIASTLVGDTPSVLVPFIVNRLTEILNIEVFNPIGASIVFKMTPSLSAVDLSQLVRGGVMTPNEARNMLKLAPHDNGDQLQILSPTGVVSPGGAEEEQPLPEEGKEVTKDIDDESFFFERLSGNTLHPKEFRKLS